MSWGERSCIHFSKKEKPCEPDMQTCNMKCSLYARDISKSCMEVTFEFIEFNPFRKVRGKMESAKFKVFINGRLNDVIWMSIEDIKRYIHDFGNCPSLQQGLRAYEA